MKPRETADTNIRIYQSTLEIIRPLATEQGKTIPRIIDEKFNPEKYQQKP